LAIEESEFNTVTYRVADHKVRLGKILPCLINGDDCLLKGHFQRLRICWEGFCAIAGLFSSLGKTYFSNNFCTINSTIYEWNETTKWWTECKYINLGLMRGQKRAGSGACSKFRSLKMGPHELGVICRELKRSCPEAFWLKVKKRFIHYNRETLDKYPLAWFLPEWLGGIGLPVDNESEVPDLNRRFATVIKMKMNSEPKLRPVKPKDMAMWKMHQLVMKDLRCFNHVELPHYRSATVDEINIINLEDNWARLYKLMTINLLEKTPLEELVNEIEETDSIHRALRHNCDVQTLARHILSTEFECYEPMTLSDMASENKDLVLPTWIREFDDYSALLVREDD